MPLFERGGALAARELTVESGHLEHEKHLFRRTTCRQLYNGHGTEERPHLCYNCRFRHVLCQGQADGNGSASSNSLLLGDFVVGDLKGPARVAAPRRSNRAGSEKGTG